MKRKLIALSMLLFLMGTTGGIYFLPTQEALFVSKNSVEQSLQEITREFTNTLKKPQLRTSTFAVRDILKVLGEFLGIVACTFVTVQFIRHTIYRYNQALVYHTPHKAKKLKRCWDDIL